MHRTPPSPRALPPPGSAPAPSPECRRRPPWWREGRGRRRQPKRFAWAGFSRMTARRASGRRPARDPGPSSTPRLLLPIGGDHDPLPARDPFLRAEVWNRERREERLAVPPEAPEGTLLLRQV